MERSLSSLLVTVIVAASLSQTIIGVTAVINEGLYVSNGTNILKVNPDSSTVQSVYKSANGRIVGLGYSAMDNGYLFWSDIKIGSRGIYRATLDSTGSVNNVTTIVSTDILEVNSLSVNWVSRLIYWTDARKRTIEVATFDGSYRRVLVFSGLSQPRGIVADPVNGYLFWNDQGYHQIERSALDGSGRQVIVSNTTNSSYWSNQMVVNSGNLYWVESNSKTLQQTRLDGSGLRQVASLGTASGNNHIYGLAIFSNKAYITCWSSTVQLIEVGLSGGTVTPKSSLALGSGSVFSAVYVSNTVQLISGIPNVCASRNCTNGFCLPINAAGGSRCSCSSFGGTTLRSGNQCQAPSRLVLYALADSGFVGYYDPDADANGDYYFIARGLRPVAVAYDPSKKQVYWSDVRKRTINRINLDGTNPLVLLDSSAGVGIVDGMALDYTRRQLYYTNIGSVAVSDTSYSWHKVETVHLDSFMFKVRTLVSSIADKPRAIALDINAGYLYYTDWGTKASIIRTQLDGSAPQVIKTELNNPNGIIVAAGKLFVVDSNYKTRTLPGANPMDGSLYSLQLNGTGWTDVLATGFNTQLKIPFGLTTTDGSVMYVSDWETNSIYEINLSTKSSRQILTNIIWPMALQYSQTSTGAPTDPCGQSSCKDTCLPKTSGTTCTCNSYTGHSQTRSDTSSCSVPSDYLLVSDMDGVKMIALNGAADQSIYVAASGRPFYSNVVALAYDPQTSTAYYSDVNSKMILALNVRNSTKTELYRVNHAIDGMTFYDGSLYWTDSKNGLIATLDLSQSSLQHRNLRSGLGRPRAIKFDSTNGFIIWTEWGTGRPRVSRMKVDSSNFQSLSDAQNLIAGLKWPNGLFIDSGWLYIADGHPTGRQLLKCTLDGTQCERVTAVNNASIAHFYDIWVSNGYLYYTDWSSKSVSVLSLQVSGPVVQPLATGLMRPSQLYFVTSAAAATPCTNPTGCDGCTKPAGTQQTLCTCDSGRTFLSNASCAALTSLTCSLSGTQYPVGVTVKPTACRSCQCLANRLYASPMNDGGFTCDTIDCPPLPANCPSSSVPTGECCPVCKTEQCTTGITITNCPSDTVSVELPGDLSNRLYEFKPNIRDCVRLSRDITYDKTPIGDIYAWQVTPYDISITASALQQDGYHKDSDTCRFSLKVVDVTPPTLICPENVKTYTSSDTAAVQWTTPTVTDNVGVSSVQATPAWGSSFPVGVTQVTYTATDKAGHTSTCIFSVNVTKIESGMCSIPKLQHGQLDCMTTLTSFICFIKCDLGYIYQNTITGNSITCTGGQWDKTIPENFELYSCLKKVAGTLQGAVSVTARDACGNDKLDLTYTKKVLENVIHSQYLILSSYPLKASVKVIGCGSSSSTRRRRDTDPDITVTVTVSGDYFNASDKSVLQSNIDYVLGRILDGLSKGFIEIQVINSNGVSVVSVLSNPTKDTTTSVCLPGTYKANDDGCIVCPSGTYQLDSKCVPCTNGTYNDKDGQTSCMSCPMGATSPAGANNQNLCSLSAPKHTSDKNQTDHVPVIIGVVVGVGSAILLIVIIIVAVCLCKKSRSKHSPVPADHNASSRHENKMYTTQEEVYDNIDDNVQVEPVYMNPDESAYNATAKENDYEHVPKAKNGKQDPENSPYETLKLSETAATEPK